MTVPVIRQLLKSLLLLLIVSVCLWFGYIRLHKMKSRDEVEHQKTTTPYDWIDRTNFSAENQTITTPSIKIGTHHTIIGTKSSERMKNAAQEHKSTTIRPENLMPVESIYHTKPNQNDAMPMIKHKAENNVFTTNRNHIEVYNVLYSFFICLLFLFKYLCCTTISTCSLNFCQVDAICQSNSFH